MGSDSQSESPGQHERCVLYARHAPLQNHHAICEVKWVSATLCAAKWSPSKTPGGTSSSRAALNLNRAHCLPLLQCQCDEAPIQSHPPSCKPAPSIQPSPAGAVLLSRCGRSESRPPGAAGPPGLVGTPWPHRHPAGPCASQHQSRCSSRASIRGHQPLEATAAEATGCAEILAAACDTHYQPCQ